MRIQRPGAPKAAKSPLPMKPRTSQPKNGIEDLADVVSLTINSGGGLLVGGAFGALAGRALGVNTALVAPLTGLAGGVAAGIAHHRGHEDVMAKGMTLLGLSVLGAAGVSGIASKFGLAGVTSTAIGGALGVAVGIQGFRSVNS